MTAQERPVQEYTEYLTLLGGAHEELTSTDPKIQFRGKGDFEQMRGELEKLLLALHPNLPLLGEGMKSEGYAYVGTQMDRLAVDVKGYGTLGTNVLGMPSARTGLSRINNSATGWNVAPDFDTARTSAVTSGQVPVVIVTRSTEIPDFPRFTPEGAVCFLYRVQ